MRNHEVDLNKSVISLLLDINAPESVREAVQSGRIAGLKIHSRIQRLPDTDTAYEPVFELLASLPPTLPVIFDAFYYGTDLAYQPALHRLIELAQHFPDRQFIAAHAGGYKILEYFFHLRPLDNVHYGLSFSLQYLQDSSCMPDLRKLLRYTPSERVIFGSDFPYAQPYKQLKDLWQLMNQLEMPIVERQNIVFNNSIRMFGTNNEALTS